MHAIALEPSQSFDLPPEWAPQSGVMLTWPHEGTIWAEMLAEIDAVFANVAKEIASREKVIITCFDKTHEQHILSLLEQNGVYLHNVATFLAPCDDVWVRDHGPLTVFREGQALLLDFTFNGWGNKYPADQDNEISRTLHTQHAFGETILSSLDMVLEGGAIETDGHGTLLTTSSCLLSKTRNPRLSKSDIADKLRQLLGMQRILWLEHGHLVGDDTDGHIDTLARFTDPHTICYITCDDENDEHYAELKAMEEELRQLKDYEGNAYKLIPLPWPKPQYAKFDGRRLPVTYANFLIINGAVLMPIYNDPADAEALKIIAQCFPQHEIVPIDCAPAVQWYGSLHCMTMQLPKGVLA